MSDGLDGRCRDCERQRALGYYHRRGKHGPRRDRRAYQAEWSRQRRKADVNYRLTKALRHRLWRTLRGVRREAGMLELLGCSLAELRAHLEQQFDDAMSWENYGQPGWEVDHIRPCSSFDLTDPAQQRECFHYTNLQPLWGRDNNRKRAQL